MRDVYPVKYYKDEGFVPTFRIPLCQFMNKAPHKEVPVTAIPVGGVLSG